jgi:hypothetical protein
VRIPARLAMTTTVIILMSGCARPLIAPDIAPDDGARICEVAVEEKGESVAFHQSVASHPAGGLAMGLVGAFWCGPLCIVWPPVAAVGATIGLVAGTICGAAALAHPEAEAQFRSFLEASQKDILKQTLLTAANSPRPECSSRKIVAGPGMADTIIEMDEVTVGMGCLVGKQALGSVVRWRVLDATDRRVLGESETRCTLTSSNDFEEWYADPAQARAEIEQLLARTGQEMAAQLRAPQPEPAGKWPLQLRAPRQLKQCHIDLSKAAAK